MEITNDNGGGSSSGGGAGGSSSRWNPTKEQLSMLEGLYGQGIRTPSAEQIQSITKKLQAYGHIEGKNVFYWFQNHKARQRQKQKMDQMTSATNNNVVNNLHNNVNAAASAAYFNRFYYPSPPVSPSVAPPAGVSHPLFQAAPHNVAYSPYYIAQPEFGFYQHCPKMVLPNRLVNNSHTSTHVVQDIMTYAPHNAANLGTTNNTSSTAYPSITYGEGGAQVTLDLFPLHPTGMLHNNRQRHSASIGSSTENSLDAAGSDQDRTMAVQTSLSPYGVGFDIFPKMG